MEQKIETRNVELTPEWQERIDFEINRLTEHFPGVIHNFRFTLTSTKHQRLGLFEISLIASVPKDTIVVKHKGEHVRPLIVECFEVLDRKLKEYSRIRQQQVKRHDELRTVGTIAELVPMEDYGRITGQDGTSVYFHRNAVKNKDFEELQEGDLVEYAEEMGDEGPQATWVRCR